MKRVIKIRQIAIQTIKKKRDERWERFPIPQETDSDLHKSEETGRNSQCIREVGLNTKQSNECCQFTLRAQRNTTAKICSHRQKLFFMSSIYIASPLTISVWIAIFGCAVEMGDLKFSRSYFILHCKSGGGFNAIWEKPCCSFNFNLM